MLSYRKLHNIPQEQEEFCKKRPHNIVHDHLIKRHRNILFSYSFLILHDEKRSNFDLLILSLTKEKYFTFDKANRKPVHPSKNHTYKSTTHKNTTTGKTSF